MNLEMVDFYAIIGAVVIVLGIVSYFSLKEK